MSTLKESHFTKAPGKEQVPVPRPSASVILISPLNQVLLLHRVKTSRAFASAHVFPGGNLDPFHDGEVPPPESPQRHADGPAYRLGAIRECFEESGILLARKGSADGPLLDLDADVREKVRKSIHANEISFAEWLRSVGGVPDNGRLIPFTRWITPAGVPRRFTTQMYIYMLPLSSSSGTAAIRQEAMIPAADGGIEHTAADFDYVSSWLAKGRSGQMIVLPPQYFLLTLISKFLKGQGAGKTASLETLQTERDALMDFVRRTPTTDVTQWSSHPTSSIPWTDKVISPQTVLVRKADKRIVLALDKPGPELKATSRGGDMERVVLVRFTKAGPVDIEIRNRQEVFDEERAANEVEPLQKL